MKRAFAGVVALVALVALAGCSDSGVTSADAYKIGCPAVDSAIAGGSVTSKVTVAGLKKLRDSGQLGTEAQAWLVATISLLESAKPEDLPANTRKLIVDGCANHGYPLRNLTG
jgi:hypothetical protein